MLVEVVVVGGATVVVVVGAPVVVVVLGTVVVVAVMVVVVVGAAVVVVVAATVVVVVVGQGSGEQVPGPSSIAPGVSLHSVAVRSMQSKAPIGDDDGTQH